MWGHYRDTQVVSRGAVWPSKSLVKVWLGYVGWNMDELAEGMG